jgi:hypothetical protein
MEIKSNNWRRSNRRVLDHHTTDYGKDDKNVLKCPHCCGTYLIKDLDSFLDNKRLLWRLMLVEVENGFRKQQIIGSLAVCSAKETAIKQIEEKGILITICLSCMTEILEKHYFSRAINKVSQLL